VAPELIYNGKPACELVDCSPPSPLPPEEAIPQLAQSIDYLAKDYDSFLRGMLDMLPTRIPGWKTRTEADLGMALLELFAFLGDQLSYYQDRVANEGFLRTAVQYESVRRLLRLIDYPLSPGSAAKALVKVTTSAARAITRGFAVSTKGTEKQAPVIFEVLEERMVYPELNDVLLHSSVAAGSAHAVLEGEFDLFLVPGNWIWLQSASGSEWARLVAPVSVNHVQHTTSVTFSAPLAGTYDKLNTHINGNGLMTGHGESHEEKATGTAQPNQKVELEFAPLTYITDDLGIAQTTLQVTVAGKKWQQTEDFIDSGPTDFHYTLFLDNLGYVTLQFGNGAQGRKPDLGAPIDVHYRSGIGTQGMVAAGSLTRSDALDGAISQITNPQASIGGVDPDDLNEAGRLPPWTMQAPCFKECPGEKTLSSRCMPRRSFCGLEAGTRWS
jgi:hypothetical protein